LLQLRKQYPVLINGFFQPLTFEPQRLLAYLRQNAEQTILVALNFGKRPVRLALGGMVRRAEWKLLLSNRRDHLPPLKDGMLLPLEGYEVLILLQET
jgi:hypothetical protein